jgi:hypothetical protein
MRGKAEAKMRPRTSKTTLRVFMVLLCWCSRGDRRRLDGAL